MNKHIPDLRSASIEKQTLKLYVTATIGASGAPTLVKKKGVTSLTRDVSTAGLYTLTLDDNYVSLLGFKASLLLGTGVSAVAGIDMVSEAVSTKAAPTVIFQCKGPTNSSTTTLIAADPDSGATLLIELTVRNGNAK